METVIITGGSGFIGSNLTILLLENGFKVINIDKVMPGERYFDNLKSDGLNKYYQVHRCDLAKQSDVSNEIQKLIQTCHSDESVVALIHMAAYKDLNLSLQIPDKYYENNILSTINAFKLAHLSGAKVVMFSSTAAVYDDNLTGNIIESGTINPSSPYAYSKVVGERILNDMVLQYHLNGISLRYQNPMGVYKYGKIDNSTSMFGNIASSLKNRTVFHIFGGDYNTKDGTPIRDYVDVKDICYAHLHFINHFKDRLYKNGTYDVFNLGSGHGTSCKEICELVKKLYPGFEYNITNRRAGDAAGSYADLTKVISATGWEPKFELKNSIKYLIDQYNRIF